MRTPRSRQTVELNALLKKNSENALQHTWVIRSVLSL
jgi:hypothetical protein